MRTTIILVTLFCAGVAFGETFQVKYKLVTTTCKKNYANLKGNPVTLTTAGKKVSLTIGNSLELQGRSMTGGRFRAKTTKKGVAKDVDARFRVSGTQKDKKLEFSLIAEYSQGGSPICSESWKASSGK